jgi:hypothetical protein
MKPDIIFGVFITIAIIIDGILFVFFGEKTVRKLRKNPVTKSALGIEIVSGWDILNVALALTTPRRILNKIKDSPLKAFRADTDLLYQYTTRFDRILGRILYSSTLITVLALLALMLLDKLGVIK